MPTRARSLRHLSQRKSFNICKALSFSARLRPARASSEGLGWLAGSVCDLASPLGVTAPSGVALSFSGDRNAKAPINDGAFLFVPEMETQHEGWARFKFLISSARKVRSLFLHGEFTKLAWVATHPAGADFPVIGEQAGVASISSPAFLGSLLEIKAGLDSACIVSALCSGHLILLSQSRQSPGRFLWRGFWVTPQHAQE